MVNPGRQELIHINHMGTVIRKARPHHWAFLMMCILLYTVLNYMVIHLSNQRESNYVIINGFEFNRYTISGIIAQGQVIAVILITLNPIKRSTLVALFLCATTGLGAASSILFSHSMDAMPGIIIPVTSAGICIILSSYSSNLKRQMHRVLEYSRIVKKNEKLLHKLAFYDSLTGLPNRKMIIDQIDRLTALKEQKNPEFMLVYLDLDNFKKINDSMGHSVGDNILRQVAMRWKENCQPGDILGRVGGDEFVILICHKPEYGQLVKYLNGFKQALKEPILIERKEFYISVSFGVTSFPEDGQNAGELIKNADIALYKAKNLGKNDFQFFSRELQKEVIKKIQIENDLLKAIRNDELYMVYQPQYVGRSKKLRGYEALLRWKHPDLGQISPAEFIPIAEESGLIVEMGSWILETVLKKFMELKMQWDMKVIVSINISVVQILEPSFLDTVKEILRRTGYDSRYLEFEITESVLITSPEYVTEVIGQLKEMGIRIALDDFGTGYASLNYLQLLPINILKIDKTFIDKIDTKHSQNKIVGAIISLSHQLGFEVIAEGVEQEEQLNYLIENKCDYIQGYLLGKPMEVKEILTMMELYQTG